MTLWQADFYKVDQTLSNGDGLCWQLLLCDRQGHLLYESSCPQSEVSSQWLSQQLEPLLAEEKPDGIEIFRPQSFNLFKQAGEQLGLNIIATRRAIALKTLLKNRYGEASLKLELPPPLPLPENLWGEQWRFASMPAGGLLESFLDCPMPYGSLPENLWPLSLGIASDTPVDGMIIYAGRQSRYLGQWLELENPVSLNYRATDVGRSGGLLLEAGLVDRWIIATFEDQDLAQRAIAFEQRKLENQGLHFLLIQPDESGMTTTGFWLLQNE